jgi:ABC-type multidrug transport system fused ATPase/permease subunit
MTNMQEQSKQHAPRPDTLEVTGPLRKSVVITCASMVIVVLASMYSLWQTRQFVAAFTGGELPLMFRVMMLLAGACALFTVLGMVGYTLAALPVLSRGRQRAIERLLNAQGWLWSLMGVTLGGLLLLAVLGKLANFIGSLWPF